MTHLTKDETRMTAPVFPSLVGFCGRAGAGKSAAAQILVERYGYRRVCFAGPLKAMLAALGLSAAEIYGPLKEQPCALLAGRTPRHAMQTLGTEWGRDLIDRDLWLRAWAREVDAILDAGRGVVVDDARFPNEAKALRDRGGLLVRIVAPEDVAFSADQHESEQHALPADVAILNAGRCIGDLAGLLANVLADA